MIKSIQYLEVRIEPFTNYESLKTLQIKIRVNGQVYNRKQVYADDDFEDRFHILMDYAEKEIRNQVKEIK